MHSLKLKANCEKPERILDSQQICKLNFVQPNSWAEQITFLALTLFVFWFNTDNAYNATTLDDLAVTADLLHGSSNFHFITP